MENMIRKIVQKYGTRNPFELADYLGAVTITTSLPKGTRGYYTYYKRNGIICIDENFVMQKHEWSALTNLVILSYTEKKIQSL